MAYGRSKWGNVRMVEGPDVQRQILIHGVWRKLLSMAAFNNEMDSEPLVTMLGSRGG